jgi:hypothetical protein
VWAGVIPVQQTIGRPASDGRVRADVGLPPYAERLGHLGLDKREA